MIPMFQELLALATIPQASIDYGTISSRVKHLADKVFFSRQPHTYFAVPHTNDYGVTAAESNPRVHFCSTLTPFSTKFPCFIQNDPLCTPLCTS